MKKIFTLGTGRRDEEDFVEILFAYDIRAIIDVRRFPGTKSPTLTGQNLKALSEKEGLEYHYLGDGLGGFKKGGYAAYALTDEFRQNIERLEALAGNTIAVILCSEKLPWKCHRKWISRELQKKGWDVEHILDKGKLWSPKHL